MHICFVLVPGFRSLTYILLRDLLNAANDLAGKQRISFETRSLTGLDAAAKDGIEISPDCTDWRMESRPDLTLVCAGPDASTRLPMGLRGFLARATQAGSAIGGAEGGVTLLAAAGHLDGHQAALPAPCAALDPAIFAGVSPAANTYCLDGRVVTATNSLAAGHALLSWIAQQGDIELASQVAEQFSMAPPQLQSDDHAQQDPVLARMQTIMTTHLKAPVTMDRIARDLDLSPKQLRLRCRKGLGQTPAQVYQDLRLERAKELVSDTVLSVEEVAQATGFASASAFTRSFRTRFGAPPRVLRKTGPSPRLQ